MARSSANTVLSDLWLQDAGAGRLAKRAALVALGIGLLALAAKVKVPFWPVPMTLQTLAVVSIGAAYGLRLGAVTLLGYLALGAAGADVFTGADSGGLAYMLGGTGGYLVGFLLATLAIGALARRGWDRDPLRMAGAMLVGQIAIFVPGVLWLGHLFAAEQGWAWVMEHGLLVFLPAEALKLAIAALLFPLAWRWVGGARG